MNPRRMALLLAFLLMFVTGLNAQQTTAPLTNDDVVKMAGKGLPESLIIGAIDANEVNFDVSVNELLALRKAGLGDKVVEAMLQAEARKRHPAVEQAASLAPGAWPSAAASSIPMMPMAGTNPLALVMGLMASMMSPQMMTGMPAASRQGVMQQMGQAQTGAMGNPMLPNPPATLPAGQLPKVVLMLGGTKQPMQPSITQIAKSETKGGGGSGMGGMGMNAGLGVASTLASLGRQGGFGMGMPSMGGLMGMRGGDSMAGLMGMPGGMSMLGMLGGLGGSGLRFAPLAGGPGLMLAGPAMALATGLIKAGLRHHSGQMTTSYVWALPGHNSSFPMTAATPKIEIEFGNLVGVDPDAYEPVLVRLVQTKDNWRLVGATKDKMDRKGNDTRTAITEQRTPIKTTTLGRGHVVIEPAAPLAGGEYGVVLHPLKPQKKKAGASAGLSADETVFYSVWDFSVPGAETVAESLQAK